mgnify:CR=1 FL=1
MATKKELLKNLLNFTATEIAEAVRNGDVTLYELSKESNGAFTPLLKKQVQTILDNPQSVSSNNASVEESLNLIPQKTTPIPQPDILQVTVPIDDIKSNGDFEIETSSSNNIKFTKSNKGMFKHPFSFKGRIRRTEYGISFLIYFLWYTIGQVLMQDSDPSLEACLFVLVPLIPMIWFICAQNCKRCHDRGNSGWYQLIPFYFFVLLFGEGESGSNSYGDNPKE